MTHNCAAYSPHIGIKLVAWFRADEPFAFRADEPFAFRLFTRGYRSGSKITMTIMQTIATIRSNPWHVEYAIMSHDAMAHAMSWKS